MYLRWGIKKLIKWPVSYSYIFIFISSISIAKLFVCISHYNGSSMRCGILTNVFSIIIPASKHTELLREYLLVNTGGKGEKADWGSTEEIRGGLKHSERIGRELEEGMSSSVSRGKEESSEVYVWDVSVRCRDVQQGQKVKGFHGWWTLSGEVICWQLRWKCQRLGKGFEENGRELEQLLRGMGEETRQHFETTTCQVPCWVLRLWRWGGCDAVFAFQGFTIQRTETFSKKLKRRVLCPEMDGVLQTWWGRRFSSESGEQTEAVTFEAGLEERLCTGRSQ